MKIVVYAPANTREVLMLLRDAEPEKGITFSLVRHDGPSLTFEVSTASAKQACGLAKALLRAQGLDALPGLSIAPAP